MKKHAFNLALPLMKLLSKVPSPVLEQFTKANLPRTAGIAGATALTGAALPLVASKPESKTDKLKKLWSELSAKFGEAYAEGFMSKCAEQGVDPALLIKLSQASPAAMQPPAPSMLQRIGGVAKNVGSALMGPGAMVGRGIGTALGNVAGSQGFHDVMNNGFNMASAVPQTQGPNGTLLRAQRHKMQDPSYAPNMRARRRAVQGETLPQQPPPGGYDGTALRSQRRERDLAPGGRTYESRAQGPDQAFNEQLKSNPAYYPAAPGV